MDADKIVTIAKDLVLTYGPKVLAALVVLIIGLWLISWFVNLATKVMEKREVDKSLAGFGAALLSITLKVLLFISVISMVGVATTSFIAVFGAATLAIGMALQGSLANFAGGALIMLFKPFKVGDVITAQGHRGKVKEISIFVTKLLTPQNRLVLIPNGPLANGDIVNLTAEEILRVDISVGIGYGEDIKKARDVLVSTMKAHQKVLNDPAPAVKVDGLGDSSVNLLLLPFAKTADFWDVYFDIQEHAKLALDEAGIEIPFPQLVTHKA